MRTVTLESVLQGAATNAGLDWNDLVEDEKKSVMRKLNRRTSKAWMWERWSELCPTERRLYRDEYDNAAAYAAPTLTAAVELFYTPAGKYYQTLRAATGQVPATLVAADYVVNSAYWAECAGSYSGNDWVTGSAYTVPTVVRNPADGRYYSCHTAHTSGASFDSTKFGVLTPFAAYVSLDQSGQTPIGEVIALYSNDPDVNPNNPGLIRHRMSSRGIVPLGCAPMAVWVNFRLRVPIFTVEEWDGTGDYDTGARVYSESAGDCYQAIDDVPASSSNQEPEAVVASWVKMEFPLVLSNFVIRATAADILRADGQNDKASAEESQAFLELSNDRDIQQDGQTPSPTVQVQTY